MTGSTAIDKRWYYIYKNGSVDGPHEAGTLRAMNLPPNTQACPAGSQEWGTIAGFPDLLTPPDAGSAFSGMLQCSELLPFTDRKKIFIIHGRGNTMDDALGRIISLARAKFRYYRLKYYVDENDANFARYILYDVHDNPFTSLWDKMLVGKLALSPHYPPPPEWEPDKTWSALSDFKIPDKFSMYGAPMSETAKRTWADQLFDIVWQEFTSLTGIPIASQPALIEALEALRTGLQPDGGSKYFESDYKASIGRLFESRRCDPAPFITMLLEFQRLNDAGGDLDTIASNALYAAWIQQAWLKKFGVQPQYGKDYEFDFVNYHQSFLHLARHQNCEIYIPDFPMEAIPDLAETTEALKNVGSFIVRIDDHHPLGAEKSNLLSTLKSSASIGDFFMSGPSIGQDQPREERTCGADLVHRNMLAGTPLDSPGLEELRRLAHQQDLHFIEDPDDREHPDYLAIDLSKLIGSKHSRIDMAQQLSLIRTFPEMRGVMEATGWRGIVDDYEKELEEILPKLDKSLAMIEFVNPSELQELRGSMGAVSAIAKFVKPLSFGRIDLEITAAAKKKPELLHRILIALAPFQTRKEPRINIASALNYTRRFFRYDYFFYAWGSSLLSTRRFNEEDQVLDLSSLMPVIGGPGDGGHSSAATCKPPSNPGWPEAQFKRLNAQNFLEYAAYIGKRIESGTGVKIAGIRMLTDADRDVFPE